MPSLGQDLFIPPRQPVVEIPSPLHIIKQNEVKKPHLESRRKISNTSVDIGPERPLTVRKKRKNQGGTRNKENWKNDCDEYQAESSVMPPSTALDPALDKPLDPLTPKASNQSRSSGMAFKYALSPSRLTGLRSYSKERESSAKTTQRYKLRDPSQSSDESSFGLFDTSTTNPWDQSSDSSLVGLPFGVGSSDASSLRQPSDSILTLPTPDSGILDPYLLVPRISVTPKVRELGDGQLSMWAAIQVSGQLYCPQSNGPTNQASSIGARGACFMPVHHGGAGLSRYGYLYDIKVEVLPTTQTSIIDLVNDNNAPSILGPGSSLLLLAYVYIGTSRHSQSNKSLRHEPNNIIADLEYQLGSVEIEYLQVRISYCHSGFPSFKEPSFDDNVSSCQTRLESTAIGVIKRQNSISTWSPRPNSTSNPLSSIIASHWGPIQAKEMLHKIKSQRTGSLRRKSTPSGAHAGRNSSNSGPGTGTREEANMKPSPGLRATVGSRQGRSVRVPRRQASLQKQSSLAISHDEDPDIDPARKIWTEMRRTSSGVDRPAFHVSKADRSPASTTKSVASQHKAATVTSATTTIPFDCEPRATEAERRRDRICDTAVRNRRSMGTDGLKGLVPSLSLSMTSANTASSRRNDREKGRTEENDPFDDVPPVLPPQRGTDVCGKREERPQQQLLEGVRKRGDGGRWSLGGWW
ncbi:hypothetical protein F4809DRAFT_28594 [Biscogniauxia mediterranea]|nr:hypothetical protein F4809DRAFT_28594 [Biscogniauxia mediterranea]